MIDVVAGLDDCVKIGEVWAPKCPRWVAGRFRRSADGHREQSGWFENSAQQGGRLPPVMVAETVNDEHADFSVVRTGRADDTGENEGQQAEEESAAHTDLIWHYGLERLFASRFDFGPSRLGESC